jgi:hypothetical protein
MEVLLVAFLITLSVARKLAYRASDKIHETVNEINEYDKTPGLDSYLDTTHRTDLKVDEYLFLHELEDADK